ncbi:MAG: hypothetical protein LBQ02_03055 [Candidatus Nomurabacteria bacterium]|jgi:hypothetical protein|nr:hypothetical protein [Candidatus Nomurabacteria bacterium]
MSNEKRGVSAGDLHRGAAESEPEQVATESLTEQVAKEGSSEQVAKEDLPELAADLVADPAEKPADGSPKERVVQPIAAPVAELKGVDDQPIAQPAMEFASSPKDVEPVFLPKTKKPKNKLLIIILLAVLGLGLIAFLVIFLVVVPNMEKKDDTADNSDTVIDVDTDKNDSEVVYEPEVIETISGYRVLKWTNVAYKPERDYLIGNEWFTVADGQYVKMAELTDEAILVRYDKSADAISDRAWFVVDKHKIVTMVGDVISEDAEPADFVKDEPMLIEDVVPTANRSYNNITFTPTWKNYSSVKVGAYEGVKALAGDLHKAESASGDLIKARQFFVKTPDDFVHTYTMQSALINNDKTLNIKWDDEANKTATFSAPLHGCSVTSRYTDAILKHTPKSSNLVRVGMAGGSVVYKMVDEASVKVLYDEYAGMRDDALSFDEYKEALTHVVYQDGLGDWVLLQNGQYGAYGECGKPVVYLYPETPTVVDVKVGAKVRISEPFYDALTGWDDVWAEPNGALTYQGQKYDSLYWEGLGLGEYPSVDGVGTVVAQADLFSTVRTQLRQQGLNAKETVDFMMFWADKLPTTPFVKLTWLSTEQMNQLAPLTVSPRPQTMIRVFLDAQGLQQPMVLQPQEFTAPERDGFTLVEWGGLLY